MGCGAIPKVFATAWSHERTIPSNVYIASVLRLQTTESIMKAPAIFFILIFQQLSHLLNN
jgi:hypothetical protein